MYGKVRAMLNDAILTAALCKKLWTEAANTATLLENRLTPKDCDSDAFPNFVGSELKVRSNLPLYTNLVKSASPLAIVNC